MSTSKTWTSRGAGEYTDSSEDEVTTTVLKSMNETTKILATQPSKTQVQQPTQNDNILNNYVKTFGWLFTANETDYIKFFAGLKIVRSIPFDLYGYSTGACYFEFGSQEDAEKALKKHRHYIGERYIKVCKIDQEEFEKLMDRNKKSQRFNKWSFLRIAGFAPEVTKNDIFNFLGEIKTTSIFIRPMSKTTSEAFIRLRHKSDEEDALTKKAFVKLGERYIRIHRVDGLAFEGNITNRFRSDSKSFISTGEQTVDRYKERQLQLLNHLNKYEHMTKTDYFNTLKQLHNARRHVFELEQKCGALNDKLKEIESLKSELTNAP